MDKLIFMLTKKKKVIFQTQHRKNNPVTKKSVMRTLTFALFIVFNWLFSPPLKEPDSALLFKNINIDKYRDRIIRTGIKNPTR